MTTSIRVLIVEDNEDDAQLVLRTLQKGGYDPVSERVDSATALAEALSRGPWDIVISDYALPSFTALDALREVRSRLRDVPVIVVSGTIGEDLAVEAIRAGANDYLLKDRLARLPAAVERELREAENRRTRLAVDAQLTWSQEQLRSLVGSLDDIVFTLDRDRRHVALFGRWLERYGVDPSTFVGKTSSEVLGEEEGRRHEEEAGHALAGQSVVYEWSRVTRGRRLDVQTSLSPLRSASGEVVGAVGVGRDITRLKQSERRLAMEYEVTRILSRAASVAEAVPPLLEAICMQLHWACAELWLPSADGLTLACGFRWRRPELSTRGLEVATGDPKPSTGHGCAGMASVQVKPHWCENVASCSEFERGEAAAAVGLSSLCAVPVLADAGIAGVLVAFSRDALERDEGMIDLMSSVARELAQFMEGRRAEEALRLSDEQLRQSQRLEAIGLLAGGVAHDFNNLLTAIIGYSDLTLRRVAPEDPTWREISQVKRAGERAATLTRQLLAFSRKQILQPKVIDLNEVVGECEKLLRRLIGEDIDLAVVPGQGLWRAKADPAQIEQVIVNLAVNSRDAMPRGGRITIETANVMLDEAYAHAHLGADPGPYLMLAVSDDGCGMDAETRARIFEPFFTTKGLGKGTGLGLSTVYGIVKQSGGHIWVYSEPGKGTTFKVYLPRFEGAASEASAPSTPSLPPRGTETVLLAEDETLVRDLVATMLTQSGYQVVVATDAQKALEAAASYEGIIPLLVTDVVMPGLSGEQLYEKLHAFRPDLRVLYISGYTDNAIVHHGVLNEGTPFLQKPFGPDALARKLREVLAPRG